jgi:hypothetical protein
MQSNLLSYLANAGKPGHQPAETAITLTDDERVQLAKALGEAELWRLLELATADAA